MTTVNISLPEKLKADADSLIAAGYYASFSDLVRDSLRKVVDIKRGEEPSEYLIKAIKEAEEDRRAGRVSPEFDNTKDAISWLNNPKRKFINES